LLAGAATLVAVSLLGCYVAARPARWDAMVALR